MDVFNSLICPIRRVQTIRTAVQSRTINENQNIFTTDIYCETFI